MGKYIQIANFKGGLDARRLETEQLPGTLTQLVDAHINQGGEIEKRKAFVLFATLPAGVFGLEATAGGLVAFGSQSPPAMPAGVAYQQLVDPAGGNMANFLGSTQFGGKAFVVAEFDTTLTWAFYNGVLVAEGRNGKVLTTNQTTLATQLQTLIAALPGFFTSGVTTGGGIASFTFWSQAGVNFSVVLNMGTGSTGLVTARQIYAAVPQIPSIAASGALQITGGSSAGSGAITSVKVNSVEIYNTSGSVPPLPYNDSAGTGPTFDGPNNAQTASDLVYKLNLGISTPSYTAVASGNLVTIQDNSGQGTTPNGFVVQITCTGNMCIDDSAFKFTGSVNGDTCTAVAAGATALLSGTVTRGVSDTDNTFAAAVAANIAAFHGTSGYTAYNPAGTSTVRVSKLVRNSNDVLPANLSITTTGTVTVAQGISGSTNTGVGNAVAVSPLSLVTHEGRARGPYTTAPATAIASGGKPPYTFLWSFPNSTDARYVINSPTSSTTTFSWTASTEGSGLFTTVICTVTDSASVSVKSLPITLAFVQP